MTRCCWMCRTWHRYKTLCMCKIDMQKLYRSTMCRIDMSENLQKHYVQNRHVRNSTEALNSLLGQTSHEAHLSAHNSHCPRLHHLRRRRSSNPPEDRWRWWWWRGVLPTIFFLNEWSSDLCSSSLTLNIQQTNTLWPVTILIIISIKTLTGCLDLRNC